MNFFKRLRANKLLKKASALGNYISYYTPGQPIWKTRDMKTYAEEGYLMNVIASRCINIIASAASQVPIQLFQESKTGKPQMVETHELLNLLEKPNIFQAGDRFWFEVYAFLLIAGNSYVEAAGPYGATPSKRPPTFLYAHQPDKMTVVAGQNGNPSAYDYNSGNGNFRFPVTVIGLSNILHIKNFNPLDRWYGASLFAPAARSVDQHNQAAEWNQSLLQNSGRPSGAVMFKQDSKQQTLTDEQYSRLKEYIEDSYTGPRRAGTPMILEGALEWVEMGLTPKDMDWLEGKNSAARDIALGFGVPPMLLGIPGDNTYSNQKEARVALWEETIIPLMNSVLKDFGNFILPRYGDNSLYLQYDWECVPALVSKRETQRESLNNVTFMTVNEKREAMGLDVVEGGDILYVPFGNVPIGQENANNFDITGTDNNSTDRNNSVNDPNNIDNTE